MTPTCRSSSRCSSICCEACCWRYSLRNARRIQAHDPRQLHLLQITAPLADPSQFGQLRKSFHNAFCYRRRQCRWWSSVGIWGWWNGTGLHGIVELGSITATEFVSALQRQGAVRLLPIAAGTVRAEVYAAAMSVPASITANGTGRYQPFKIAIAPVIVTARPSPIIDIKEMMPMPMPMLLPD